MTTAAEPKWGRGRQRDVVPQTVSDDQGHAAAITAAEYAIAGDWVDELPDVLTALGLDGGNR